MKRDSNSGEMSEKNPTIPTQCGQLSGHQRFGLFKNLTMLLPTVFWLSEVKIAKTSRCIYLHFVNHLTCADIVKSRW